MKQFGDQKKQTGWLAGYKSTSKQWIFVQQQLQTTTKTNKQAISFWSTSPLNLHDSVPFSQCIRTSRVGGSEPRSEQNEPCQPLCPDIGVLRENCLVLQTSTAPIYPEQAIL